MRPTFAVIHLSHLKSNFLNIRRKVKDSRVMAVVKADAYGHGVKEICNALNTLKRKPEYFGVATAEEGVELRRYGIKQPVLIFEPVSKSEAELVIKNNLIPTVSELRHLNIIQSANPLRKNVNMHIKVDTGMNRLGVRYDKAFDFVSMAAKRQNFTVDGIYTHFATSDETDKSFAVTQLGRFRSLIEKLKDAGINYGLAHCANSGAIIDMPDSYLDMVRPGISLYGYYPSLETSESVKLKPVMSIYSVVNSLKAVPKDEGVSYGRKYITPKDTQIAAVPVGYADGFRRGLTNKAYAIIKGEYFRQSGTVTMDRIMFDVGNNTKIKTGDKVILLGEWGDKKIDAWDWSKLSDTIPYEITCGISKRVRRVYR
jgi:alanine racemase